MANAPHIPTNLPPEEREALAKQYGIDLSKPQTPVTPAVASALAAPHVPTNAAAEDAAKDARDAHNAFIESQIAAGDPPDALAVTGDGEAVDTGAPPERLIYVPDPKPSASTHDLAIMAARFLCTWVGPWNEETKRGGPAEVDETMIAAAVDAAAALYLKAEERLTK